MNRIITLTLAGWLLALPAWAQTFVVDPAFGDAMKAQDDGDYQTALDVVADSDVMTRDLVKWMQYRADEGSFADMAAFLGARPTWPGLSRIRGNAEMAITDQPTQELLAFFQGADVETGEGAVAYANALTASGNRARAEQVIVDVWTNDALTDTGHQAIVNAFADVIAPHHGARADMLLWRGRTSDARNVLPLLGEGQQALVRARIALATGAGDAAQREALVPARLKDTAGLQYDRFTARAAGGDWTEASDNLMVRSSSADALGVAWRWGSWRRILARWHMREGNIDRAYAMASAHFIAADETNYSDLEWLAGYIALTHQRDYARALRHFTRFDASVSSPISKGRAGYWLGRAHDALGDTASAIAAYRAGAQHQTTFYGLLSAEKLGLTLNPDLVGGETFGDWRRSSVLNNELVRAGLTLLDAGERGLAVLFFVDAAPGLTRQEIGQIGAMFMEIDEPFYALLVAKAAVRTGTLVQDVYFPLHPMADMELPVEPALALAIARQESEFRIDAGSSVGALGIMQLMPATAQEVAGWLDMPFSRARLTSDWAYNATLGSEYLAFLMRDFGDSPVMIAAGYNAGPSRPKSWMDERGDPRMGFGNATPVDVIDWIEHIPFRETRNYVMRVTEGIPVYRARLTGQIAPVQFSDLLIGARPVIRPVMRARNVTVGATVTRPITGSDLAVQQSLRPVMRATN